MARKRSRKLLWGMILAVVIVVGVGAFLIWNNGRDKGSLDKDDETADVKEEDANMNQGGDVEEKTVEEVVKEKEVVQYEGDNPNEADQLSGVVTYAGVSGGKLVIRLNIDQYLTSGSCELTLIRNGVSIYSSIAGVVGSVTTATCEGFDVPVSELGEGKIDISVNINADGRSGVIRGEVNI